MLTFRGMFAAASLKRCKLEPRRRRGAAFPRHVCRGLIEAITGGGAAGEVLPTFRGMFAAASLKQGYAGLFGGIDQTFRGMFAAASLKRAASDWGRTNRKNFPRHVCRGLIEAVVMGYGF